MKTCSKCGETKPLEEFHRDRSKSDGHRAYCKECGNAYCRAKYTKEERHARYAARRTQYADYHLRRTFGMTLTERDRMLIEQDGCCYLCGTPEAEASRGRLHVDHDHRTGKVRGLLCHDCNTGLGKFKDSPALLRAAADYLERNGTNGD